MGRAAAAEAAAWRKLTHCPAPAPEAAACSSTHRCCRTCPMAGSSSALSMSSSSLRAAAVLGAPAHASARGPVAPASCAPLWCAAWETALASACSPSCASASSLRARRLLRRSSFRAMSSTTLSTPRWSAAWLCMVAAIAATCGDRPPACSARYKARPGGTGRPPRPARRARFCWCAPERLSCMLAGMMSTSATSSEASSGRSNCTRQRARSTVRRLPECTCRVLGCLACTRCPTLRGRGRSGGSMSAPRGRFLSSW
mmetsp:Transcript_28063/g.89523  ORF Transcript_28063/g.89523 Transcript_28063/m.89523 type:complete len:257 (-) Transcript_28063:724-1494(-)